MLWIALVIGLVRTLRASKRSEITADQVVDISLYGLLAGIVFAHLTSILLDLPYYLQYPSEIVGLWSGILSASGGLRGLSFHGGLAGAIGAALLYTRLKRISFMAAADLFVPALALGYGIVRIGCFLNGCCYGVQTSLPWGVRFHIDPVSRELTLPSHPTQIYAMMASFLIFAALLSVEKRRRFPGQVFFSYLAMYSVYRFLIEFLRKGVTAEVAFAGLTQAQVVSLAVLMIAVPFLLARLKKLSPPPAEIHRPAKRPPLRNPQSACGTRPSAEAREIRNSKGG